VIVSAHRLRPFVAADTMALRDLFAQSIEVLTVEDYSEDQRLAWAATAEDAEAFSEKLAGMLTLVVMLDGEYAGFGSLRDNKVVEMLYVHPYYVGLGVGTALMDAFERLAAARGTREITLEASQASAPFFEDRGYVAKQRNLVPCDGEWLANTTMTKTLAEAAPVSEGGRKSRQ
jgi:putative acetyltransferase